MVRRTIHQAVTGQKRDRRGRIGRRRVARSAARARRVEAEGHGRARVGEIRKPLWRQADHIRPSARSYDYQLRKKVEKRATGGVDRSARRAVIVVDALSVGEIKDQTAAG